MRRRSRLVAAAFIASVAVAGCARGTTNGGGSGGGPAAVCGDGLLTAPEQCDDANTLAGDGCSPACLVEPGWLCSGAPSDCTSNCGDGIISGAEECDDGDTQAGDGCSPKCKVEPGWSCKGTPSACGTACGDGVVAGAEGCDDGDVKPGDGCSAECAIETGWACDGAPSVCGPVCGDGLVVADEGCDDGGTKPGDGCSAKCVVEVGFACQGAPSQCTSTCGDGVIASDEQCDDGDTSIGDGCDGHCAEEPGWACGGEPSACVSLCGDGRVVGAEACDDGNLSAKDGCSPTCALEPGYTCVGEPSVCEVVCGDGVIGPGEQCDDGNAAFGDGCSSTCHVEPGFSCANLPSVCLPICGDGVLAGPEACDDGDLAGGDGCSAACTVEPGFHCAGAPSSCSTSCGDGILAGAEACDDANTMSGDGCSATCGVEPGFQCYPASPTVCAPRCGDGLVVKGEQCDDGNALSGDCCSAACQREAGCELEANGTRATANDLAAVGALGRVRGFISPAGDVDVYKVTVPAGAPTGSLTATILDGPLVADTCMSNKLDTRIDVYDQAGNLLVTDEDSAAGLCSSAFLPAAPPGDYFVQVKSSPSHPSATYSYTLQVNGVIALCGDGKKQPGEQCDDGNVANGDGCSSACTVEGVPYEVEPNDAFSQADASSLVLLPPKLVMGTIGVAGEHDLFKVQLPQAGVVRFETFDGRAPASCAAIATRLRLFDASQVPWLTDAASGIGECAAITAVLPAGPSYVQVEAAQVSATIPAYFLELAAPANGGVEAEPNDTASTATAISGADVVVAGGHQAPTDGDWYAVSVPAGHSIRAEIIEGASETCESLGVDSRVTLYDAGGAQLDDDDDGGRGYCSLLDGTGATPSHPGAHALPGGTYYLLVRSSALAQNGAGGQFDYRLVVTVRL